MNSEQVSLESLGAGDLILVLVVSGSSAVQCPAPRLQPQTPQRERTQSSSGMIDVD